MRLALRRALVLAAIGLTAGVMGPSSAWSQGGSVAVPGPVAVESFGSKADPWGGAAFDVVLLRPLGFAWVVVGAALFVPVAIITSPGGKDAVGEGFDRFVREPSEFTFRRPLGDF